MKLIIPIALNTGNKKILKESIEIQTSYHIVRRGLKLKMFQQQMVLFGGLKVFNLSPVKTSADFKTFLGDARVTKLEMTKECLQKSNNVHFETSFFKDSSFQQKIYHSSSLQSRALNCVLRQHLRTLQISKKFLDQARESEFEIMNKCLKIVQRCPLQGRFTHIWLILEDTPWYFIVISYKICISSSVKFSADFIKFLDEARVPK